MGMRVFLLLTVLISASASAQPGDPLTQIEDALNSNEFPRGEGWAGFLDFAFLGNTLLTLILATVLGAIVAYHPKHIATADNLEELEAPKVYILYAVIGSIIGILVVGYGLVVGFVLFGIGGLQGNDASGVGIEFPGDDRRSAAAHLGAILNSSHACIQSDEGA